MMSPMGSLRRSANNGHACSPRRSLRRPERFPNGRPSPRPLPTAVWINPPKADVDRDEAENAMTPESHPITIGAVRSSLEADLDYERPEIPNLHLEDLCMAVAQ